MAGSMNNRTERSDAVQGFTKSGLETVHVGESGDCRNRLKLRCSGVICLARPDRRTDARTCPYRSTQRERAFLEAQRKLFLDLLNCRRVFRALSCRPSSFRAILIPWEPFAASGNPTETVRTHRRDRTLPQSKMRTTAALPKSPRICVLQSRQNLASRYAWMRQVASRTGPPIDATTNCFPISPRPVHALAS